MGRDLLEDVGGGRPPSLPWQQGELSRVLTALDELAEALAPSPIDAPPVSRLLGGHAWSALAADPSRLERLPGLDPWVAENLEGLARLESALEEAASGTTLLHADLRADNILLTPEKVVFVDWPHASIGAAWVDLLFMLPRIAMQGGPDPDEVFGVRSVARDSDPEAVLAVLAAFAGYMVHGATRSAPPGLPNLPAFQRAQGHVAVRWLRRLLE